MTQHSHENSYQKGKDERNGNARSKQSDKMRQDKSEAVNKGGGLPFGKIYPKNKCRQCSDAQCKKANKKEITGKFRDKQSP